MSPDDRWRVSHMAEAAEQALAFVIGRERADLDRDPMLRLALTRAVEVLGGAANRGVEDRKDKLGCVLPGESPAIFGDPLRRMATAATYLYQDGTRYWYSTQPTVTKLAEDQAEQLKREPDKVADEIKQRLVADLRARGDSPRVHVLPVSSADVPDDTDARPHLRPLDRADPPLPGCASRGRTSPRRA